MTLKRDAALDLQDLKPVEEYHWATYVPGRTSPYFSDGRWYKRHQTLSHAKNAVGFTMYGMKYTPDSEIYHWEDKEWVRIYLVNSSGELEVVV